MSSVTTTNSIAVTAEGDPVSGEKLEGVAKIVYESIGNPVLRWAEQTPFVAEWIIILFAVGLVICSLRLVHSSVISGLLISLGIFGTFYGILTALEPLDFSPEEMNDSVEKLLDGMKIAFSSSLLGLGSAIIFRVLFVFVQAAIDLSQKSKKNPAHMDMNERLDAIKQAIVEGNLSLVAQVEKLQGESREIKQAIAGDDDVSLAAQVVKLQGESREIKQAIAGDDDVSLAAQVVKLQGESREIKQAIAGDDDVSLAAQVVKLQGESREIKQAIAGDDDVSLVAQVVKLQGESREIKQAIAGDDDSSLAMQMQKLRQANEEGFKKLDGLTETIRDSLVKNLENLIKDLRDIIANQLSEQLGDLIKRIEDALIKQFGKTFVEFNEGVQALKKWQEDHRVQVEQLTRAFDETARGIAKIKESSDAIPATMEQLEEIVKVVNHQINDIKSHLEGLDKLKKDAREFFPEIEGYFKEIGDNLSSSAEGFRQMDKTIKGIAEEFDKSMRAMADNVKTSIENSQGEVNQEMNRVAQEWGRRMVSIAAAIGREITEGKGDK